METTVKEGTKRLSLRLEKGFLHLKIKEFKSFKVTGLFTCMMTARVDINDKGSCYSNTKN